VLDVLHHSDHVDEAPATVYAKLLDEDTYLAGTSTMCRLLRAVLKYVSDAARPPTRGGQEARAGGHGPDMCWSWDITKLLGPEKWSYFHLYVVIDIYSRYVTGWMMARSERAKLAEALLAESVASQGVSPGPAHRPRRPGHLHGLQAGGLFVSRPGRHQISQPTPLFQRQSLL
jgi:putative transposase